MITKNAKYIKAALNNPNNENTTVRVEISGLETWVPISKDNSHYAEILRQVAAGTLTIADAD